MLAVTGPTASGKSSLALELARARPGTEIVAVDAFTLYRGMDIGTAKPSPEERAAVVHHGIDLFDPSEEVSVARFQRIARRSITAIMERGGTPLLVGGSGLYFRAVIDDLEFPPTDPDVRSSLTARHRHDPAEAHRRLAAIDPVAAAKIEPGNLRRTVRALEVLQLTGRPFSSFARAWERYESVYSDLGVAYLEPPSSLLRRRIEDRARRMVGAGLVDEAAQLRQRYRLSRTASQAIGYREAFAVLDGTLPIAELAGEISRRTWSYAKRQRSWFRRDPRCRPETAEAIRARWTTG